MSGRGRLIAFEGVEGAGKSTHLRAAAAALRQRGIEVIETREPGGTPLGAELRRLVMYGTAPAPMTELLLYLADRAQHVAAVVAPAMARGAVVLTDRFSASTLAYQSYARGLDLSLVSHLDEVARQGVAADLVLLLDCGVDVGLGRARGSDRFHREDRAFHERVRQGFLALAAQDPLRYRVLDATAPMHDLQREILVLINACVERP